MDQIKLPGNFLSSYFRLIGRKLFRRVVIISYSAGCCMSGLTNSSLLIASHIVPWSKDKHNWLNSRNRLCLSAMNEKAFGRVLIELDNDYRDIRSKELQQQNEAISRDCFHLLADNPMILHKRLCQISRFGKSSGNIIAIKNPPER